MISSYGVIALSKGTGNSESPFDLDFEQSCLFVSMVTAVLHSFIHFMLLFTEEFKMVLSISKQICALINIKYMLLKLYGTLNLSLFVIESVFDFSRSNKSTLLYILFFSQFFYSCWNYIFFLSKDLLRNVVTIKSNYLYIYFLCGVKMNIILNLK